METWDAVRARRNLREYKPDPVAAADLLRITEAGWRATRTARENLGAPDGHLVFNLLGVGHPADRPLRPVTWPSRRPFGKVVHQSNWGRPA